MTDKELLEWAAKAAGISDYCYDGKRGLWVFSLERYWNPLTDDGDKYRLARNCHINIHFKSNYVSFSVNGYGRILRWPEDVPDDTYAIVRAAAAIGKEMK